MKEKELTSVEWFAKELYEKFEMKGDGKVFDDLLEQANKMHKKQIILAHGIKDTGVNNMKCVTGEQYYNETFKQQVREMCREQISYSESEVLQLLLKLQTAKPYENLYDWFQQNKKQQEQ